MKKLFAIMETKRPEKVALEILGAAKTLGEKMDAEVVAVVMGDADAKAYAEYADVLHLEGTIQGPRAMTAALEEAIRAEKPDAILLSADAIGREIGGRITARMRLGLVAGATSLGYDEESGRVEWVRPTFDGKLLSTIRIPTDPQIGTIDAGVYPPLAEKGTYEIRTLRVKGGIDAIQVEILEKSEDSSPEGARVVIACGMGAGNAEKVDEVRKFAKKIGVGFGVTKPVVDNGWAPFEEQIGISGKRIEPDVYVGFGVSGAKQHVMGMQNAKKIIAVNTDPEAPLMKMADMAIEGDLDEVLAKLQEKC